MATVYKVVGEVNECQSLAMADVTEFFDRYPFDGKPLAGPWEPPEVFVRYPLLHEPDIWPIILTVHAYEQRVMDAVRDVVTPVGELLPLMWEGRELSVLNVTYVEDCFDREAGVTDEDFPSLVEEYAFDLSGLKHSLFKIPETALSQLYTVEGLWSPDREFKAIVEQHGLRGLEFLELWTDGEQPMPAVYKVMREVDEFQTIKPTALMDFIDRFSFDGSPIGDSWEPPDVYLGNPLREQPDIWSFAQVTIAFEERSLDALRNVLRTVGEFLPLPWEGRELQVLNVTYIEDCFDPVQGVTHEEFPEMVEQYAFDVSRLSHSLFRIPQTTLGGELLTAEGLWSPDREFKAIVEQHCFQGLDFLELWTDGE